MKPCTPGAHSLMAIENSAVSSMKLPSAPQRQLCSLRKAQGSTQEIPATYHNRALLSQRDECYQQQTNDRKRTALIVVVYQV